MIETLTPQQSLRSGADHALPQFFDLHTHSKDRRGEHEPVFHSSSQVVQQAYDEDLQGVAVANHNTLSGTLEAMEEGKRLGLIVVPAIEVTCRASLFRHPHLLVYGLHPDRVSSSQIPVRKHPQEVIAWAHGYGGLVFAAHPASDPISLLGREIMELTAHLDREFRLDGAEVCGWRGFDRHLAHDLYSRKIPISAGSDAHWLGRVGKGGLTSFPEDVQTWQDAIEAMRCNDIQFRVGPTPPRTPFVKE